MKYNMDWLINQYENGIPLKFIYFWGNTPKSDGIVDKSCFSQWFEAPFIVAGITYKTSEHWMMAHKALLFGDKDLFERIILSDKPGAAKELGRQVTGYSDDVWNANKYNIVKLGNIHKFNQNPLLADYLLKTKESILTEASPADTIWGIGLAKDNANIDNIYMWRGENLLGFVLMETRDFLSEFGLFETTGLELLTPWNRFPGVELHDIFWRMGKGEEVLHQFMLGYEKLSERDKTIYRISNPKPYNWPEFYDD